MLQTYVGKGLTCQDRFDDIRRKRGQLQHSPDIAAIDALLFGDVLEVFETPRFQLLLPCVPWPGMLGSIWSWAGEIRTTQKNIGVGPKIVTAELGVLAIESGKRHSETGELVIATAAEFHHRAVWVHPFEDGNGRWAKLLANIWLMQHDQPRLFGLPPTSVTWKVRFEVSKSQP
jgi:hypothetical protein